ncbi:MAG: magnesium chelatase subunit D [Pseudomonadota bacterium]
MPDGSDPSGLTPGRPKEELWQDAGLAAALLGVDPEGLGGAVVRARPGPARDRWLEIAAQFRGDRLSPRRVPASIDDERLLGGLDLAATLSSGKPIVAPGVLEEAAGRGILLPMAERATTALAVKIGAAMDAGGPLPFIGLDEGAEPDDVAPEALLERVAFRPDLTGLGLRDLTQPDISVEEIAGAQRRLATTHVPNEVVKAIVATAAAFGITSLRAPQFAIAAARAIAALNGSDEVEELEAQAAVRLVLAWKARQLPASPEAAEEQPSEEPAPPDNNDASEEIPQDLPDDTPEMPEALPEEMLIEAARAALPPDLFAQLLAGSSRRMQAGSTGAGEESISLARGRPLAPRPGHRGNGARLDLVATLRTAAPWQPLRKRTNPTDGVIVTPEDFRIKRFRRKTESALIFVVDASGSAAAARLAEAKGAIELMLADAYQRREQVSLVSFRGAGAEVALPLTRSLVQAKRRLQGVPGGGGTPLASGLALAQEVAAGAKRSGMTPFLVFLTDGRANICLDGAPGRRQAAEDASKAARAFRQEGFAAVLIDTANRPQASAEALAGEMGARYVPLPRAGSEEMARVVQAATA